MENSLELVTKISLNAWNTHIDRVNKLIRELTDDQLQLEVSPGRNSGTYLLGTSCRGSRCNASFIGFGRKNYIQQLEPVFIRTSDKSGLEKPAIADLRNYWNKVNNQLAEHFSKLSPGDWLKNILL